MTTVVGPATVNFNMALPGQMGVAIGPRIMTSTATTIFLDYTFLVISSSSTGFQVQFSCGATYSTSYSMVAADYFASTGAGNFYTYSTLPNMTYSSNTVTSEFSIPGVLYANRARISSHIFVISAVMNLNYMMVGCVLSRNVGFWSNAYTVSLVFNYGVYVTSMKLAMILIDESSLTFDTTQYYYAFEILDKSPGAAALSLENYIYPTFFVGMGMFVTTTLTYSFNLGYANEPFANPSFQYSQDNLQSEVVLFSSGVVLIY